MSQTEQEQKIIKKYNKWFDINDHWWMFMNDGYCPLDDDGYPIDFLDISLSKKYKMWKYQTYMYKILLETIGIYYNDNSSSNKVLLDIGCGRGGGLSFYNDYYKFKKLIGIDLNPNHIEFCKNYIDDVNFFSSSATNILLEDNILDIVTSIEACGYYNPFEKFVKEINRVLKIGGIYVSATRSLQDEKIFLNNGFEKIHYLNISKNTRISCAIGKWKFLEVSPMIAKILHVDETLYYNQESDYNITSFKKINNLKFKP